MTQFVRAAGHLLSPQMRYDLQRRSAAQSDW
jgi:hypothetical protein